MPVKPVRGRAAWKKEEAGKRNRPIGKKIGKSPLKPMNRGRGGDLEAISAVAPGTRPGSRSAFYHAGIVVSPKRFWMKDLTFGE